MNSLKDQISKIGLTLLQNVPLKKYTTLKVGGPAKYFVEVENTRQLISLLKLLHDNNKPFFILGKGSNLVISDKGIDGCVILNNCSDYNIKDEVSSLLEKYSLGDVFK